MSTDLVPQEPDLLSTDEAMDVLRHLTQAFQLVDRVLSGEVRGRIWVVSGIVGDIHPPEVQSFDDRDSLCRFIAQRRAAQNADATRRYYLHIFYGQHWKIQKGREWHLWDGKKLIAIDASDALTFVDESGSLLSTPDLDAVVPEPTAPASPNPPPVDPPVLHVGTPVLGEEEEDEEAEAGEDPDVV